MSPGWVKSLGVGGASGRVGSGVIPYHVYKRELLKEYRSRMLKDSLKAKGIDVFLQRFDNQRKAASSRRTPKDPLPQIKRPNSRRGLKARATLGDWRGGNYLPFSYERDARWWGGKVSGGFTLVELLVVMAIVGLLAGVLIPAVSGSREAGREVACGQNLRQIGVATLAFGEDHRQRFPRSQHSAFTHRELVWARSLAGYLGSSSTGWRELLKGVYRCAADDRSGMLSYGSNVYMEVGPEDDYYGYPQTWRTWSSIPKPSGTILFGENESSADHVMPNFWGSEADARDSAHDRHRGRANYLFVDGHVEMRRLEEVFDLRGGVDAWHPLRAR